MKKRDVARPSTQPKSLRKSRENQRVVRLEKALGRQYDQLDGPDPHPIDQLIAGLPSVRAARDRILRLSATLRQELKDDKIAIKYEDEWTGRAGATDRLVYGAGHAAGLLIGRVEALFSSDARGFNPDLLLDVKKAINESALPPEIAVAVLVRHIESLLVGPTKKRPVARVVVDPVMAHIRKIEARALRGLRGQRIGSTKTRRVARIAIDPAGAAVLRLKKHEERALRGLRR